MSERDTHFLGFAELLMDDLLDAEVEHYHDDNKEDFVATLIAQRAYDLVAHTIKNLSIHDFEPYTYEAYKAEVAEDEHDPISHIPDLDAWPTSPGTSRQIDRPS